MPLFRRKRTRHQPAVPEPSGTLPCSEHGCLNQNAVECAYVDRRGRQCPAAFCPAHWTKVNHVVYCRRHAGTVSALGPSLDPGGLPELENRGPSLVNWIAGELDTPLQELLRSVARPSETMQADTEVMVIYDQNRRRRWERSWKLTEHTGVALKVSIQVSEDEDDALIEARVNGNVIARGVPPWIARRRAGQSVSDDVDGDQRRLFRSFFLEHISAEVQRQHRGSPVARAVIQ